jgi:hypothetical protein
MADAFAPRFTITHAATAGLTAIERARGFLEATTLSEDWIRRMSQPALLLEAHHTTHIEGTHLTLEQAERLWAGQLVAPAAADEVRELLNYREAFDLVSEYLSSGEPITEGLIREIHKRLVNGVRGGRLNARQADALEHLLRTGRLDIRTFEGLCPGVSRRTLQRDLGALEAKGLIRQEGLTNNVVYLPVELGRR